MAADASIYGLIRHPAPGPGPLDNYGQMLQLRSMIDSSNLHALQRTALERNLQEDEQTSNAYKQSGGDPVKLRELLYGQGLHKPVQALDKQQLEMQEKRGNILKTDQEGFIKFADEARKRLPTITDQGTWAQFRDEQIQRAGMFNTPEIRNLALRAAQGMPAQFDPTYIRNQVVSADKLFTPDLVERTDGQRKWFEDKNAFTNPSILNGSPTQMQMTPGEVATDRRGWAQINQPVWSEERGAFITRPAMGGSVMGGGAPRAGAPQAPTVITPTGLPPKPHDIANIRKEFNDLPEVRNYRASVPILDSAVTAPDTKSGDIQFAYTIGKIFDPNSVVREGELKLVGHAANVMQKYKGELAALTEGKGRLTPQTRAELLAAAQSRVSELKTAHDKAREVYSRQAKAQNLPEDQIFMDLNTTRDTQPPPTRAQIDAELKRRGIAKR